MSDIKIEIEGYGGELQVADFDVQQDAMPISPGDSAGSVGDISVSVRSKLDGSPVSRTPGLINKNATVTESLDVEYENPVTRGVVSGKITKSQTAGARTSFSMDTVLAPLQAEREVPPFYGSKRPAPILISRDNIYGSNFNVNVTGTVFTPGTGAGSISQAASGGPFNDYAYLMATWTTASTAPGSTLFGPQIAIGPNSTYTLSHYVGYDTPTGQLGSPSQRVRLGIRWYTSTGTVISSSESADFMAAQGIWTRASVTAAAPANAATLRGYLITVAGAGYVNPIVGATMRMSGNLLEQSATVSEWFDGSSPSATWSGTPGLSSSSLRVLGPVPPLNYDATQGNYFRYLCGIVGIPESVVDIDSQFEGVPVAYPHWKGNVWEYVKRFASAIAADVTADQDRIYLRPRRQYVAQIEGRGNPGISVDGQAKAQGVQIYNYNTRWLTDGLAHIEDSTYSVAAGATQYKTVQTDHSFDQVNSPVAVYQIPDPSTYSGGTGVYVVRDSEGKQVDPAWWTANGGSVTARYEGNYGEFVLAIKAPAVISTTYKSPYKVGDAGEDVAGIYITASGVFVNKQLISLPSGAGPELTSILEAATIDNPFIGDESTAYDRGSYAAQDAGGPVVTTNIRVGPGLSVSPVGGTGGRVSFGTLAGARFIDSGNVWRITSARSDISGTDIEARADMTFADMDELYSITYNEFDISYAGLTFSQFDSLWASGTTFTQFDSAQPSATFADYDAIFEGMTFDQHSVTPYLGAVIVDDPEATV